MIIFEMQMPNHAPGKYHKVEKWEMTRESTHALISSYASETMDYILWQDTYTIPLEWKIHSIADIEIILTAPGAPMAGGTIVSDHVTTLACAQARKWAEVKIEHDRRAQGTFTTSSGTIQINDASLIALSIGRAPLTTPDATVPWTMADNSSQALTSTDMTLMLSEVGAYRSALHTAAQVIRAAIYAEGITITDVPALDITVFNWPAATVHVENEATPDPS